MGSRKIAWALGFYLASAALDVARDVTHVDWLLPLAATCKVMFWVVLVGVLVDMVRDLRVDQKAIREYTGNADTPNRATVHIVLEKDGEADAVDGVYFAESAAVRRRDELNMRADDPEFAVVVTKYVSERGVVA